MSIFLVYCLIPNHFHLIIKIKDEIIIDSIPDQIKKRTVRSIKEKEGTVLLPQNPGTRSIKKENGSLILKDEKEIGDIVVKQLKRLFITYSMAINKQENRVGNLFDPKYKRLEINNQDYLEYAIFYVHCNPEKHGIISNFKNYRFSSYKALAGAGKTNIDRDFVYDIFGGRDDFINYHNGWHDEREAVIME